MNQPRNYNKEAVNKKYFSIRKLRGYGATSIAVASFYLLFGDFNSAKAAEELNHTTQEVRNKIEVENINNAEGSNPKLDKITNDQIGTSQVKREYDDINQISTNQTNQFMSNNHLKSEETPIGNNEKLKKLINQYKNIDLSNKTDDSVQQFKSKLANADEFIENQATQNEIDNYYRQLINSASLLKRKTNVVVNENKDNHILNHAIPANNTEPNMNNRHSAIKHQNKGVSFRAANEPINNESSNNVVSNDSLNKNEVNTHLQNGNFDQVTGGNLPSNTDKLTVVTGVDGWHSLSTAPDPEYPMTLTTAGKKYSSFMSDSNAPYGVVLARTTDGYNRKVLDPRVAGIYQDIDVNPGSELVVEYVSSAINVINSWPGVKAKVTSVDGSNVYYDKTLNGMGKYPTGRLSFMINVPDDVNRLRLSFLPVADVKILTSTQTGSQQGFGTNKSYLYGGIVSRVKANSGAYVTSNVDEIKYDFRSDSSTSNYARGTISVSFENKGHFRSKETKYVVALPAGSKFISATNVSTNFDEVNHTLTLDAGRIDAGATKNITYTIDFPATQPNTIDLNGNVTYKTDAPFRGNDTQKLGTNIVNQQQVDILMYKEDLRDKYNNIKQYLSTINETDYSTTSINNLKIKLEEANAILNEALNHTPVAERKSQEIINQLTTELEQEKVNLKLRSPEEPKITTNNEYVYAVVTPPNNADKVEINYIEPDGMKSKVITKKVGDIWTINDAPAGFTINPKTGGIAINYIGVAPHSEITASATKGNSDPSNLVKVIMPVKETTPPEPTIVKNEENASLTLQPQGDTDKMTINYVDSNGESKQVIARKVANTWKLSDSPKGISINDSSGAVTVNYEGVQGGSEVTAQSNYGNSDSSEFVRDIMPLKQETPELPAITTNEQEASVTVTPEDKTDKMVIHYVDANGNSKEVIATKIENGWTIKDNPEGFKMNPTTGELTISHVGVQNGSEVTVQATQGNSNPSEVTVQVPYKEATPKSPVITTNNQEASITVTPQDNTDKIVIKYVDSNGKSKETIATKVGEKWSLNDKVDGINIDEANGVITINHGAVENGSNVTVQALQGNSNPSEVTVHVPYKEVTPKSPVITTNNQEASVIVTPQDNTDKMVINYVDPNGNSKEAIATKIENKWTIKDNPKGFAMNSTTGELTITHKGVQNGSEVTVQATQGNSNPSETTVHVPYKEVMPEIPVITTNEQEASVIVTPQDNTDKIVIKYVDPNGKVKEVVATKSGNQWSIENKPQGFTINPTTGELTISHEGVQNRSEITVQATQGNSNPSEVTAKIPYKEVTPKSPIIKPNKQLDNVIIIPQTKTDKIIINIIKPKGNNVSIIVTKVGKSWKINKKIQGIKIDRITGAVTIRNINNLKDSKILASSTFKNSDTSAVAQYYIPNNQILMIKDDASNNQKDDGNISKSKSMNIEEKSFYQQASDKESKLPETGNKNTSSNNTINLLLLILGITIWKFRVKKKDC